MKLHFALVGNQNCGKSTLFNYLTGSNQHVGNFPGVTVQKKEGTILAVPDAGVIDLPGIYSLSPYTSEEIVTRDLLLYNKPDAIINVIDATNIERSLYLSLQLIELNIPMVIALNMMDELTGSGGSIDIKAMEDSLTVPVVPITANSGDGVGELLRRAVEVAQNQQLHTASGLLQRSCTYRYSQYRPLNRDQSTPPEPAAALHRHQAYRR